MVQSVKQTSVIDLAKACGVSPSTVCRALNDRSDVSQKTRDKVMAMAEKLGYCRNVAASTLRGNRDNTVAILMPGADNELYMDKIHIIKKQLELKSYKPRLYFYKGEAEAVALLKEIISLRPSGLIACLEWSDDIVALIKNNNIPAVAYDSYCTSFPSVTQDREYGAYLAISFMLQNKRRKVALLGIKETDPRFPGAQKRLKEETLEPLTVISVPFERNLYEYGYNHAAVLAEKADFDALFCVNDACAIGAMKALLEKGIRIPEDVSVIGFDDISVSEYVNPALSTVAQPIHEIGEKCVELLHNAIDGDTAAELFIFKPYLVIRNSS